MRLSVLDRSPIKAGHTAADALRATVAMAREVERLGYHRFWVSEHHSVPGIAGSAPTVLAAAIAAATERIRIGTGGVMLPNHQPLVVAEQFGVLASLFPGRIDIGLGRSVGFTGGIRRALGHDKADVERFPEHLDELLSYLDGGNRGVHANPGEGLRLPVFLLATGAGALHAAEKGLPLVIAPIGGVERMAELIDRYRAEFRPSPWGGTPYVVVSSAIAIADSEAAARRLLVPETWSGVLARTQGAFPPLLPPAEIEASTMTDRERELLDESLGGQVFGTEDQVLPRLRELLERTGADELLVTTSTYDDADRLGVYRRLAAGLQNVISPEPGIHCAVELAFKAELCD
ncbi:LLM class flavin-dependent oxidoreductase [Pseudonocardiaceae bacterium YIM PH 21723]|nr:LLM class flavin-dependent oxidoreductase [Pseudonocardiaceae bacterium YIM PH 21723]